MRVLGRICRLYSICQRYNFESNLQPQLFELAYQRWLYSICQRYNFESNLQHTAALFAVWKGCIRYVKDTILKAIYNSETAINCLQIAVFDMSKIQFWKQFTTGNGVKTKDGKLYSICQRYNFESNLQPLIRIIVFASSCIRYVKDTILKAIYNISVYMLIYVIAVFDMSKIQY